MLIPVVGILLLHPGYFNRRHRRRHRPPTFSLYFRLAFLVAFSSVDCKAIKWTAMRREKFYNQAQTRQLYRNTMHSSPTVASHRRGWWCWEVEAVLLARWQSSRSLHRTRLGYNKSRDINIWKQSVRGLHSECLCFSCLTIFLPSFLPSVFFFANIQLPTLPSSYDLQDSTPRLRLLFRRPSLLQHQMCLLRKL